MLTTLTSLKTGVAAALGVGVLLTGGVGMAAAGALPGGAQETASDLLAKVGVAVPGEAPEKTATDKAHPTSDDAGDDATTSDGTDASEKGQEVSELARSTDLEGAEKGAAVSDLASEGRSKAGDEHDDKAPVQDNATTAGERRDGARDHAEQDGADAASGPEARDSAHDANAGAGETEAEEETDDRAKDEADGRR